MCDESRYAASLREGGALCPALWVEPWEQKGHGVRFQVPKCDPEMVSAGRGHAVWGWGTYQWWSVRIEDCRPYKVMVISMDNYKDGWQQAQECIPLYTPPLWFSVNTQSQRHSLKVGGRLQISRGYVFLPLWWERLKMKLIYKNTILCINVW